MDNDFDLSSEFFKEIKTISQKIIDLDSENINQTFNIFTEISDIYWRENLHSGILKTILDPNTPIISDGNPALLNLFLEIFQEKIGIHKFSNNVKISTEETTIDGGRIDIFIQNLENNEIILIENKLNEANDMQNQLPRYYDHAKKIGGNPIALIYMPLYDKEPPYDSYSNDYDNIINDLKKIVSILPAKNLATFLDECLLELDTKNEIARVFISQYSNLIKSLGGNKMIIRNQIEILKEMLKNRDNFQQFKILGGIWNNRVQIAGEVIIEELKNNGFSLIEGNILCKKLSDSVFLIFKQFNNYFNIGVGIKEDVNKEEIKKIVERVNTESFFIKDIKEWNIIYINILCVYNEFIFDECEKTLDLMKSIIVQKYKRFEELLGENKII